jgi:predicted aspartyl protease
MINNIIVNVQRYLKLRCFSGDVTYNQNLKKLQVWQQSRLAETYWVMHNNKEEAAVLDFFLIDIYNGVNLEKVGKKLTNTAKVVDTIFSDLSLVDTGIEYNTLTGEIDQQLTIQLFETMGVAEISTQSYIQALQQLNTFELRHQQVDLLVKFSNMLHEVLESPTISRTLKLSKYPAKLGGLGEFYDLVMRGFDAISGLDNSEETIASIMEHERQIYINIEQSVAEPFTIYSA